MLIHLPSSRRRGGVTSSISQSTMKRTIEMIFTLQQKLFIGRVNTSKTKSRIHRTTRNYTKQTYHLTISFSILYRRRQLQTSNSHYSWLFRWESCECFGIHCWNKRNKNKWQEIKWCNDLWYDMEVKTTTTTKQSYHLLLECRRCEIWWKGEKKKAVQSTSFIENKMYGTLLNSFLFLFQNNMVQVFLYSLSIHDKRIISSAQPMDCAVIPSIVAVHHFNNTKQQSYINLKSDHWTHYRWHCCSH